MPVSRLLAIPIATTNGVYTPSVYVCRALLAEKACLAVHDPRVSSEAISLAFTSDAGEEELLVRLKHLCSAAVENCVAAAAMCGGCEVCGG